MDHLEALGRCAGPEIALLNDGDVQSAQSSIPSRSRAEGAASDDQNIELLP
jgi:hypothetical protein